MHLCKTTPTCPHTCRELSDQKHAALLERRLKEEEDIREALRVQDEIVAKKMQESDAKR